MIASFLDNISIEVAATIGLVIFLADKLVALGRKWGKDDVQERQIQQIWATLARQQDIVSSLLSAHEILNLRLKILEGEKVHDHDIQQALANLPSLPPPGPNL